MCWPKQTHAAIVTHCRYGLWDTSSDTFNAVIFRLTDLGTNLNQVCNCGVPGSVLHCSDTCRMLNNAALTAGSFGDLGYDFFWGE
jgi:hypothetical protein